VKELQKLITVKNIMEKLINNKGQKSKLLTKW